MTNPLVEVMRLGFVKELVVGGFRNIITFVIYFLNMTYNSIMVLKEN